MRHIINYTDEAVIDLNKLDNSQAMQVRKSILKVSMNPLPKNEGGYGEPLGNKQGYNLTGLRKIKLLKLGIRVIYKLVRKGRTMEIIVIAARADDEVYKTAFDRIQSNKECKKI
jgi:mRNA interferase RelE/StbE